MTSALTPVLSDRYVANWTHVLMTTAFGIMFLFLSYLPLQPSITWFQVSEGRLTLNGGRVGAMPPQFPLAEGMSDQSQSWLSKLLMASVEHWGGDAALGSMQTLVIFSTLLLLGLSFHRITGVNALTLGGVIFCFYMSWSQFTAFQTSTFGSLCATALLWLLSHASVWRQLNTSRTRQSANRFLLWSLPLLIALWANLDSSFLLGLAVVACCLVGQVIDHFRNHSWRRLLKNPQVLKWLFITEICCLTTLLQPEGFFVWTNLLQGDIGSLGPASIFHRPLTLLSWSGAGLSCLWLTALLLFRLSRSDVRSVEILLLCGGSAVLAVSAQQSAVVVPFIVLALTRHATNVHQQWRKKQASNLISEQNANKPQSMKFALSLTCLLLGWVSFALSPLSQPLLGGTGRSAEQMYGQGTPLALTAILQKQGDTSMAWAPAEWSDWLAWKLGSDAKFFTGSHLGRFPAQVRRDYVAVYRGEFGWNKILDRYGVETLIINKRSQTELLREAKSQNSDWRAVYEDDQCVLLRRRVSDRLAATRSEEGGTLSW